MSQQLSKFMYAISDLESGHDYNAVGPHTGSRYGRARGKYQIMETIWPGWAKEAGVAGASWSDPAAQERVARYKMSQYYDRYKRWDLVAVAWFAGPGRANEAQKKGIGAVGGLKDIIGTSVAGYVDRILRTMSNAPAGAAGMSADAAERAIESGQVRPRTLGPGTTEEDIDAFVAERAGPGTPAETMAGIMTAVSEAASRNGGKVLNVDALFGDLFGKESDLADPMSQWRPQERNIEEPV